MDWLVRTLEAEIIPRLMATYRGEEHPGCGGSDAPRVQPSEVLDFTNIALHRDASACRNFIESVRHRGVSLDTVYLELISPAARRLDHMWAQDDCDFTQITVALWRMQQVMHDLSPSFQADERHFQGKSHSIMLMPVPGSQHTLGVLMVAEFFRRAGWRVWGEPAAHRDLILQTVHEEAFDIAGLSLGSEAQIAPINEFISDMRGQSKNPALRIMVGGPLLCQRPELTDAIHADLFSTDAEHAVAQAHRIMEATVRKPTHSMTAP